MQEIRNYIERHIADLVNRSIGHIEDVAKYIRNNTTALDAAQPCWGSTQPTNLTLTNNVINENSELGTSIGFLSADPGNTGDVLTFSLVDDFELDNDKFSLIDNELVSARPLDFEAQNEYRIKVGVRNQFGEKIEAEFIINILDIVTEEVTTIEITDTSLQSIYYHQSNFVGPTKLKFTNLTTVSDIVYFYQNTNLCSCASLF